MVTPFAIVDLIAILPIFLPESHFQFVRLLRLFRVLRMLRLVREREFFFGDVTESHLQVLRILFTISCLVFITGGLIFEIESKVNPAFATLFDGLYFAVVSLTTVGFGDLAPISWQGARRRHAHDPDGRDGDPVAADEPRQDRGSRGLATEAVDHVPEVRPDVPRPGRVALQGVRQRDLPGVRRLRREGMANEDEVRKLRRQNVNLKQAVVERLEAAWTKECESLDQFLELSEKLYTWRSRLIAELEVVPLDAEASRDSDRVDTDNVDTEGSDAERIRSIYRLISVVVEDLDQGGVHTPEYRRVTKKFLATVALRESRIKTRVQNANGPARSFFQIEAHRAKDCCAEAQERGWLATLAAACGRTEPELAAAAAALPDWDAADPAASARFPAGSLIEECLRTNDLFGVYMTRICLRRLPQLIPADSRAQACYYYDHWKVEGGDECDLKARFEDDCRKVAGVVA